VSKSPPTFQFYPADFSEGSDDLTLAEVGGYIRLLCSQWAKGSVPGDNVQKLAVIMRCTPAAAKAIWAAVREKFTRGDDGLYRNARLERERQKQANYRALQAQRGKASADKRWGNSSGNAGSTESVTPVKPSHQPEGQPDGNPKPDGNSLSLSSSSKIPVPPDLTTSSPSGRPSPHALVMSPLRFAKLQETHAFIGARLRVPHVLHDELRTKLGGLEPDRRLRDWYAEVNDEAETQGLPILDVFEFLRPRFKVWASGIVADVDLERFRPKGA
jgi:uncharacterized protein YdaU (DUF1376 family)